MRHGRIELSFDAEDEFFTVLVLYIGTDCASGEKLSTTCTLALFGVKRVIAAASPGVRYSTGFIFVPSTYLVTEANAIIRVN